MVDPKSRFYECESLGFPAVSNYDYATNTPSRGLDNRSFRWEEVAAETTYLLKESTNSGSFEDNSFYTGVTNFTGVNFITTGALTNSGSYPGWVVSGDCTVYVHTSGVFVSSGNLPLLTGSFQAHPLDGTDSIGLYCGSGQNRPTIYSGPLATGLEGPIILDNNHQLYLQAKLNYGSTGRLYAYPRAIKTGAIVGYYDSTSRAWQAGVPTGYYPLTGNIETIKYNFSCSNFPAATPDSLDLVIYSTVTGTFLTVDNVHIDAYMKKNAFIDFLVPSGYYVQITPDIGWHNILDMFESSEVLPNPHLRTFGPYQVGLGNLTDNLDNTVTAIIDVSDFDLAITSDYPKYLWRALPITDNGRLGIGGLPAKFFYVGKQVDNLFTVDAVSNDDHSTIKIISGKRTKDMVVVLDDNETHPNVSYPSQTTWKIELAITSSVRVLKIFAKDSGGSTSSIRYVELKHNLYSQNSISLWNVFDEHGLVADIERLPNETNYEYSLRIRDVYKNKGGATFLGIVNGSIRELALNKVNDGLVISIVRDTNNLSLLDAISLDVTSYSLRIRAESFEITENLFVDPVYGTVDLTYLPIDIPIFTSLYNLSKIDNKDITIVEQDDKSIYRLSINNQDVMGKFVEVKYKYCLELLFKKHRTLEALLLSINGILISGVKRIKCSISSLLSGNESSLGLFIGSYSTSNNTQIPWSPIVLRKISDLGYRNYFLNNEEDSLKDTEYFTYVEELKNNTKIFWGSVEADRDRWDSSDSRQLSMDSIPTLFDPPISKIMEYTTGANNTMDPVAAWGKNYKDSNGNNIRNVGLNHTFFVPGVAHRNDLKPSIYYTTSRLVATGSSQDNIGTIRNNNNYIIFSGQR